MGINRQSIIEEYAAVMRDAIEKLEALDKKHRAFAKIRIAETRVTRIGAGYPEFLRNVYTDEILFYPQPGGNLPPKPESATYKLPDIDPKRYMTDYDYFDALSVLEFPDRSYFYAACGKYFKMSYNQVNPIIAELDPDDAEQRATAWREVIKYVKDGKRR